MPTDKQIARGCRHFNGLQHDQCEAGVEYKQFLYHNYHLFPCRARDDGTFTDACPKFEFRTVVEIEAEDQRMAEAAIRWVEKMAVNICPWCGESTEPKRQVGRCVYGACGCRLYQGKLGDE